MLLSIVIFNALPKWLVVLLHFLCLVEPNMLDDL